MDSKRFNRIAKALADPRRFGIFEAIAGVRDEMSCGAIAEQFPIGQSTVSHHLKVLTDAELVDVRRDGQHCFFSARPEMLNSYLEEISRRLIPGGAKAKSKKAG